MGKVKRIIFIVCGAITCALGLVGIVVPVLPTTPFLLLSAFLFSRSSERLNAWLVRTKAYQAYVAPFKESGGITLQKKLWILGLSYAVMGVSAVVVQRWYVWAILGCVAVFLLWLMMVRIPTIPSTQEAESVSPEA